MANIIFEPTSSFNSLFLTFIIIGVVSTVVFIWSLLKNKKVLSLLSFIGILICGSSAIMNSMAAGIVGTVSITETELITPSGEISFAKIKAATITNTSSMQKEQQELNIRFADNQEQFLIVETADDGDLIFSANNYPIETIKDSLDARIYRWYEQKDK